MTLSKSEVSDLVAFSNRSSTRLQSIEQAMITLEKLMTATNVSNTYELEQRFIELQINKPVISNGLLNLFQELAYEVGVFKNKYYKVDLTPAVQDEAAELLRTAVQVLRHQKSKLVADQGLLEAYQGQLEASVSKLKKITDLVKNYV